MTVFITLTELEARYGIDFNDANGDKNYEFSPTDAQLYHATNDCMISSASTMLNSYAGKSLSGTLKVKEACAQLTMRLVAERYLFMQLTGAQSMSDEYGALSYAGGSFELMTPDIKLLIDEDKDWAFVSNTQ